MHTRNTHTHPHINAGLLLSTAPSAALQAVPVAEVEAGAAAHTGATNTSTVVLYNGLFACPNSKNARLRA